MQPQGVEQQPESIGNARFYFSRRLFSTFFSTFFNGFGRSQNSKQPFLWFVKIIKPIPDSRGSIKTLSEHWPRPRQSHFFTPTK